MKNLLIGMLQFGLGYKNYLIVFSILKIAILSLDARKRDYLRFVRLIRPASNVLIIGANTGITLIPIARRLKSGVVTAFEPIKMNFLVLNNVIRFFGLSNRVNAIHSALGEINGTVKMILPIWKFTRKHGLAYVSEGNFPEKFSTEFSVVRRLDDLHDLRNAKFDFVKIVAENYEYQIFLGAKEFLTRNRPTIYCELWQNELRQKVLELLRSLGYEAYVFREGVLNRFDPDIDLGKYFLLVPVESAGLVSGSQ